MYYRMTCPRCRRRIEYTDIQVGHHAHCKNCNLEVILRGSIFTIVMYFAWAAAVVFMAYGGIRVYRMVHKEHRFSGNIVEKRDDVSQEMWFTTG